MKNIAYFLTVITLLVFTSCSDDPEVLIRKSDATFNLLNPSDLVKITQYTDVTISFTELNTKEKQEQKVTANLVNIELNQGSYEVSVSGKVQYDLNGETREGVVVAFVPELNFVSDVQAQDIQLALKAFSKDFIIEEVFFTGTLTPEGEQYYGDQYFKIYNNTDEVLYADGLILAQSKFLTVDKQEYTPDVMKTDFTTGSMIQIPGSGKEYAVEPGESLIIALGGINHKENNAKSIDLSSADFEMFYEGTDDVDNPAVTNVINFYDRIVPHNRGFNSYVLVRLPEGVNQTNYISDYKYNYEWLFVFGEYEIPQNESDYKIPNEWIVDAVNMSVESEFEWVVTDASLDSGYTYCGKVDRDASRYGKSVKRKVLQEIDGVRLLQDTNNSANDFIPEASLSVQ
ncbi:DUF4876 domain-containing protein [Tenacibaculum sp. Mcav3-52]|uniref:DUF4876 domain-containing protein n=1 Tax=Tenacibaculum mesophilum TaxID=104268 RepID=A0AAE9MPX2_9FLAO|nr:MULTISPECIES: DUF4876 domain-containing protein [Tenacibaculum]MCG7501020.1 DUF4876 domain-containing protein [Tenacibaculum sp. Mcav3-52]UTD15445.1 DUF4876 domain-containing protein [Tenacibaculum mesophilum]